MKKPEPKVPETSVPADSVPNVIRDDYSNEEAPNDDDFDTNCMNM